MSKFSRRDFMKGAALSTAGIAAAGLLTACGPAPSAPAGSDSSASTGSENLEASATPAPEKPVDGKYVTSVVGHEGMIHVATTLMNGSIVACEVLSHEETMGIGNYACTRIPAAIVKHQSINVPNLRGCSVTSEAVKRAVKQAIEESGYDVADFSAEVTPETSTEVIEDKADVIIIGAGTSGLVAAARLLEAGKSVILVEKRDIPGGSFAMTYGGVATAGSQLQTNFDVDGSYRASAMGTLEGMMNFWKTMKQYHRPQFNGEMPYMTKQYEVAGDLVDWLHGMGIGFNTLGNYEGGTQYGAATPYLAPGCYEGGAGYAMMFLVNRIGMYKDKDGNPMGKIIYSTSATDLIKDEKSGKFIGCHAEGTSGAKYTLTGKAVCLASGGFARNKEMLAKYEPQYADFFFNCPSSLEGDGIRMGLEAGGVVECEDRPLPAFLSSYKSKFELAFVHNSAPGIMVNINGENVGNIVSDNHYSMAKAKLSEANGDTFYYIFDEASAAKLRDCESYGFNGYVAMFEKGEAVHYDSVEAAAEELKLPDLAASIQANNEAALAGEPDAFGRKGCPYIETRTGLWAIRVDPTFYLTTAGLAIDTDAHVLTAEKKVIPGLYAAGDVCGSIEEKDGKQYGMGFDAALIYGFIMGDTIKKDFRKL